MITKKKYERAKETLLGDGVSMVANTDAQYLLKLIESLHAVARAASLMRDAEVRLSETEYKRGSVGHDFIGGQVLLWKTELHEALDAVPEWVLESMR